MIIVDYYLIREGFLCKMAQDSRVKIVKQLIEEGKFQEMEGIFLYVTKTEIAGALGINYTRFLRLVKSPGQFRYNEVVALGKLLHVSPRLLSDLIHSQLEKRKPQ